MALLHTVEIRALWNKFGVGFLTSSLPTDAGFELSQAAKGLVNKASLDRSADRRTSDRHGILSLACCRRDACAQLKTAHFEVVPGVTTWDRRHGPRRSRQYFSEKPNYRESAPRKDNGSSVATTPGQKAVTQPIG